MLIDNRTIHTSGDVLRVAQHLPLALILPRRSRSTPDENLVSYRRHGLAEETRAEVRRLHDHQNSSICSDDKTVHADELVAQTPLTGRIEGLCGTPMVPVSQMQ
ncbi:MAG: hypothetical protein ABR555_01000 [Pyrinomonadaceae bacterium]